MTSHDFEKLLRRMTDAICRGDGPGAAACFVSEGEYHDGFYGAFSGREAIAGMVSGLFHRDAERFQWRIFDAACDGRIGYARYEFSYVSKMAGSEGRGVAFPGICVCKLEGGLIRSYGEIFERATVLARLGFADARILKSVKRWSQA